MRTSKCMGELTFTFPNITGRASIASRPPWMISPMRMQSRAASSDEGSPDHTRSVSRAAASALSRCRTSSAHVVGLQDVAPRRVERISHLRQLQQLLEVGHRAVAALAVDPHERRAVGGAEDHVVAAHDEIPLRVARVQ